MSNCTEFWIARRKHQHNKLLFNPQGKTANLENGMWYHRKKERDRWTERERGGGREDAVLYEKGFLLGLIFGYINGQMTKTKL